MPIQNDDHTPEFREVKRALCEQLGFDPKRPPLTISPADASQGIGAKESTLSQWRTLNRYNLRYTKMGRHVRYRLNDIVNFIIENTTE